jgi:hypothetical protein
LIFVAHFGRQTFTAEFARFILIGTEYALPNSRADSQKTIEKLGRVTI